MPKTVPSLRRNRSAGAFVVPGIGSIAPKAAAMRPEHFEARDHAVARPAGGAADVHVLDEADLGAPRLRPLDERDELVVVDAADHDRVDLERCEAGPRRGLDAAQHARQLVEAGELLEPVGPQRVEADRDPVEARRAQGGRVLLEQHAVGRHREVVQPRLAGEDLDERGQVVAHERLAARQADAVDAERAEDVGEPADLFELEQVRAGKPHVVLLGHAVVAAQVAAVRHREAEVAERAAEAVRERHGRSIVPA